MNNILLLLGIIFLNSGDSSILNNLNILGGSKKISLKKSLRQGVNKKMDKEKSINFKFDDNHLNNVIKLLDLSEEDLELGMELITRTKKYMSPDEIKVLTRIESIFDLVSGIKKLSNVDSLNEEYNVDFFRNMDKEDKKNMMIKEILDIFPQKKKPSIKKALDMKKKIDLFAELFLPDDSGNGGFSLSSLADISNLGNMDNLKMLGGLLRSESTKEEKIKQNNTNKDLTRNGNSKTHEKESVNENSLNSEEDKFFYNYDKEDDFVYEEDDFDYGNEDDF